MKKYALVTGYIDINRNNWETFSRSLGEYTQNAQQILGLDADMIIFVEHDLVKFVGEYRPKHLRTYIHETIFSDLKYSPCLDKVSDIMRNPKFKPITQSIDPPEYTKEKYVCLVWSKIFLINSAFELHPEYTHLIWIDFGLHKHIFIQRSFSKIPDKIRLCCRENISPDWLNNPCKYLLAHRETFAAGLISGNRKNIQILCKLFDTIAQGMLENNSVGSEQGVLVLCYLTNPFLFDLYFGDWSEIMTKY